MRLLSTLLPLLSLAATAHSADPNPATLNETRGAWPLYRQWTPGEVAHYGKWIGHIYEMKVNGTREQQLAKLERVLTDPQMNLLLDPAFVGTPSNPQIDEATMRAAHTILDCGKLTVVLGAYYAYRRGLPWMSTAIRANDGGDLRTCPYTIPVAQTSYLDFQSPYQFISGAVQGFCTGNYRVEPEGPNAEWSDTAPVAITRQHLLPGAMFYLDGHVLILAQVDPYGELRFLDATTSPTRDIYTHNRLNAVTGLTPMGEGANKYSGCYRGFRVTRWPIAETDAAGRVIRVRRRTDQEMQAFGYSTEQYAKLTELTRTGHIREGRLSVDSIHDFVRLRMRSASEIDPVALINVYADTLLKLVRQREDLVQAAWRSVQREGAIAFPANSRDENIYNANGRWGEYASTALDTRIRAEYFAMISDIESAVNWFKFKPDYVKLSPRMKKAAWAQPDLALMLAMEKERAFFSRAFSYTNSAGQRVPLTLRDLEIRLYDLSFDPNHPPELRWGAGLNTPESRTAKQSGTPMPDGRTILMSEAYNRQAYYRTLTYRDIEESYLDTMVTSGFPKLQKFNEHFATRWIPERIPPLVPAGWKNFFHDRRARMASLR